MQRKAKTQSTEAQQAQQDAAEFMAIYRQLDAERAAIIGEIVRVYHGLTPAGQAAMDQKILREYMLLNTTHGTEAPTAPAARPTLRLVK
jgi:hypothetical protein